MSNQSEMFYLLKAFSGRANILTVTQFYVDLLDGDIRSALLLSQIIYWSDKSNLEDGWFYKTYAEWEKELRMSERPLRRYVNKLRDLEIIETELHQVDGAPTLHYRVNFDKLVQLVTVKLEADQSGNGRKDRMETVEKTDCLITETTLTEITLKDSGSSKTPPKEPFDKEAYLERIARATFRGLSRQHLEDDWPEDVRSLIMDIRDIWGLTPPRKTKSKNSQYGYWIASARDLLDACGDVPYKEVLLALRKSYDKYKAEHEGVPPYTIASPNSLVNVARAQAGEMRIDAKKPQRRYVSEGKGFHV